MTRRWPLIGVVFAVLWVFVRGVDASLSGVLGVYLQGLVVGIPIAYVFRRLYATDIELRAFATSLPYAVLYVVVFLREIVVANVDVAIRVLAPGMPIEPEVILVPLRVETAVGVTTIANSITITPGTITLDHDPEENALYVHVIDGRDPDSIVEPIRTWEDYALLIFDEERSPTDPAPEIAVYPPGTEEPPDPSHPAVTGDEHGSTQTRPERGGDGDGH